MEIDDVSVLLLDKLKNKLQYSIEPNKIISKYEDDSNVSSFIVDLAVLKGEKVIMLISKVDKREKIDKLFYDYSVCCPYTTYYVVLCDGELVCKESPYCRQVYNGNIFELDPIPSFNSIEENKIDKECLVDLIIHHDDYRYVTPKLVSEFLTECAQKYNIDSVIPIICEINDGSFEYNNNYVWLDPITETKLITSLLNYKNEIPNQLYRYTTKKTLDYLFNTSKKVHSMSSLVIMNDPTEMDYANIYLNKSGVCIEQYCVGFDKNDSVHSYITSLTELKDDLTLWRLYGDDAKGVCIEYSVPVSHIPSDYILARVSYADEDGKNSKLEFIAELLKGKFSKRRFILRRWHEWQHFFKPYEYAIEKEVRLLTYAYFVGHKREWITTSNGIHAPILNVPLIVQENNVKFPLSIKRIIFGSKFHEKDVNRITWEYKIKDEFSDCVSCDFQIVISTIDNYR